MVIYRLGTDAGIFRSSADLTSFSREFLEFGLDLFCQDFPAGASRRFSRCSQRESLQDQTLRCVPSEMLKAPLNIDKETAMKIPVEKLVVI
jgi:hypothetical protein